MRYGSRQTEGVKRDWLKLHAMVGCRTHVVTAVEVTERHKHDTTQFVPLLDGTAETFNVFRVYADGAYCSSKNLEAVEAKGAEPYVPFSVQATGKHGSPTFKRLFHLF